MAPWQYHNFIRMVHTHTLNISLNFRFSGRRHTVYTGVILLTRSKKSNNMNPHGFNIHQFYEATDVQMATMTPDIIKAYIETGEPM